MPGDRISRRLFMRGTGSLAAILALSESACTARDQSHTLEILSPTEAREFDAIAARILPTTDTPGAREAGVIYFMDKAFGSIMADDLPGARRGLADFQAGIATAYPGAESFSDLDESDQDDYLRSHERSAFFAQMRFMTLCGFFAMSSYGGNRDNVGWELIGFDGHHGAWQPPFGHYDAEYMREQNDGE